MPVSKYTVHVPANDDLGNPIRVHQAIHQHLLDLGHPRPAIHEGNPFHHVSTWAEESPEMDSMMKQIGTYAGDVANADVIGVTKEGKNTALWEMQNPNYRPGEAAEQSAFANEPNIADIGLQYPDAGMGKIPMGTPMPPEVPMNPLTTASFL